MLRAIAAKVRVEDVLHHYTLDPDDGPLSRFYGKTLGCGCCSTVVPLTADDLKEHISDLEEALAEAREALAEIERNGPLL